MQKPFESVSLYLCVLASIFVSFISCIASDLIYDEAIGGVDNSNYYQAWRALAETAFGVFTIWGFMTGLFAALVCAICLGWSVPPQGHSQRIIKNSIRFTTTCWLIMCAGPLVSAVQFFLDTR